MSDKRGLTVIQPVSGLANLKLPDSSDLIQDGIAEKIRDAVTRHGGFTDGGEVLYNAKGVPALLRTDTPGGRKVVADLPGDQVIADGNGVFVKSSALNEELSKRIQQPRDASQLEDLKYSENCLNTVRDNPELEKRRLVLESVNRRNMPKVKKRVLNQSGTCLSGKSLDKNAQVHHVERVADQPGRSADPTNMVAVTPEVHKEIHKAGAHTPDALNQLAEDNGWPGRVESAKASSHSAPSVDDSMQDDHDVYDQ